MSIVFIGVIAMCLFPTLAWSVRMIRTDSYSIKWFVTDLALTAIGAAMCTFAWVQLK